MPEVAFTAAHADGVGSSYGLSVPVPILDCTGAEPNLDWLDASYEVEARPYPGGGWEIGHRLTGAPQLRDLLREGAACWAVEVRCPATMYVETFVADDSARDAQIVKPSEDMVSGTVDLWPGLLAVRDCTITPRGLSVLWENDSDIEIAAGRWLTRYCPLQPEKGASLVVFRSDDVLREGELRIAEDSSHGYPMFVVTHHPVQDSRTGDDVFCVMAFSAALAMAAASDTFNLDDTEHSEHAEHTDAGIVHEHRIVSELARMLENRGVPLWNSPDWDPMRAATALLELPFPTAEGRQ